MKTITLAMGQIPLGVKTYPRAINAIARTVELNTTVELTEEPYSVIQLDDEFAVVRVSRQGAIIYGLTWVLS